MAYKKRVYGRAYPHLYNLHKTVGSRKSTSQMDRTDPRASWGSMMGQTPSKRVPVGPGQTIAQETYDPMRKSSPTVTVYCASNEPNRRDDVMLVQYLLKRVYQRGNAAEPPLNQSNGTSQLKIDGIYGPKTQKAIEQFQLEMARNGRSIAVDGAVDPELGDSATSSISKTGYTISWLNKYFYVLWPELFHDIRIDPECPQELRNSVGGPAF